MNYRNGAVSDETFQRLDPISDLFDQFSADSIEFSFCDAVEDVLEACKAGTTALSISDLENAVATCGNFAEHRKRYGVPTGLSEDQIAALALYSLEFYSYGGNFFTALNSALRSPNRSIAVRPYAKIIWLILTAMAKCKPHKERFIYRLVRGENLKSRYIEGSTVMWHQFSSCTHEVNVSENETEPIVEGMSTAKTLFTVELTTTRARDISDYAVEPLANEIVLPPNTVFKVLHCANLENQVTSIHLLEQPPEDPILNYGNGLTLEYGSENSTFNQLVALRKWLASAGLPAKKVEVYCDKLIAADISSVEQLRDKLSKMPDFLLSLQFNSEAAEDIREAIQNYKPLPPPSSPPSSGGYSYPVLTFLRSLSTSQKKAVPDSPDYNDRVSKSTSVDYRKASSSSPKGAVRQRGKSESMVNLGGRSRSNTDEGASLSQSLAPAAEAAGNGSTSGTPTGRVKGRSFDGGSLLPTPLGSGPSSLLVVCDGHTNPVKCIAWSPNGAKIVSGSYDPRGTVSVFRANDFTLRIWNSLTGVQLHCLNCGASVLCVAWSVHGEMVVCGLRDNTIKLWDAMTGALMKTYQHHGSSVHTVAWNHDMTKLASAGQHTIKIMAMSSESIITKFKGHSSNITAMAWSPDGKRIASGSNAGKTIKVWDPETGSVQATLKGHEEGITSVGWSPDGRRLASGSNDTALYLWSTSTYTYISSILHPDVITSVAWSPVGYRLATGCGDGKIRVFDPHTGSLLATYTGHTDSVLSVAWSPDGTRLASTSADQSVRVWRCTATF